MSRKKEENFSFLDNIETELLAVQSQASDLDIIQFIERILDAFDLNLFLSQRCILKAIYGLPLTEEESKLLTSWRAQNKTNWKPNDEVLAEINAINAKEGKPLRKRFNYQNITLQAGMRSSKSSLVGLIVVYEYYKLITNQNPQLSLGVPSSSSIYLTVLASTEEQTKNTIFGYVKSYIQNTTFFKSKISRGELIVRELGIECPEKNIHIASGHSRATSIVGRSAMLVAFDELAMFANDEGGSSNASEVYSRVGRSTATFGEHSKRIAMSSVKEQGDYMQELVEKNWDKQTRGDLIFDLTTFDMNPMMTQETTVIAADYDRDIVAAQRDYENIRPNSAYGFLNPLVVDLAAYDKVELPTGEVVGKSRDPMASAIYRPIDIQRSLGHEIRTMSALEIAHVQQIERGFQSVAHCDPGIVHDSFGFACGHAEYTDKGIVTVIDLVLEWMPRELGKGKTAKVDFINVEDVLLEVAKKRNITRLTFDHWQGESHVQRLYRGGIPTFTMHFSGGQQMKMYDLLRTRLNQGLIKIPNHPALVEELKSLELRNGSRVDHPKAKKSDIQQRGMVNKNLADCVAAVNWVIAAHEKTFARELGLSPNQAGSSPMLTGTPTITSVGRMRSHSNINWNFQ